MSSYPKVVVFDLDYTLWPFWCDTHISPPLKAVSKTEGEDRYGTKLALYPDVASIITELYENDVVLVAASRTATPKIAQELLRILHVKDKPLIKYFLSLQWGQGSKIKHIRNAAKHLKLEAELKQGSFILYDDEYRNRDVETISCKFAYLPNEMLTRHEFEKGLKEWAEWKSNQ